MGLELSLKNAWRGGTISTLSAYGGTRDFEGIAQLQDTPRADRFSGMSLQLHLTQYQMLGLTPILRCYHDVIRSNVALYTSDSTGCGLRLTRAF